MISVARHNVQDLAMQTRLKPIFILTYLIRDGPKRIILKLGSRSIPNANRGSRSLPYRPAPDNLLF